MSGAKPLILAGLAGLLATAPAAAFEPREGCFVAERACPALRSIQRRSNPGDVLLEVGRTYQLLAANKPAATHFQLRLPGTEPRDRWVEVSCGRTVEACELPVEGVDETAPRPAGASWADNLLAVSWQPAFCEGHRDKPECASQTPKRFDATHLALHGLWPQPRDTAYCGVDAAKKAIDRRGRWDLLEPVQLSPETRRELQKVMPGTQSQLDRHEWIKHGVCYSATAEEYYREAIQLVRALDESAVGRLLAARIGQGITLDELRGAFDQAFGAGSGDRVAMDCKREGGRNLVVELKINLKGEIRADSSLAGLLAAASPAAKGCMAGEIDPAGFAATD